VPAVVGDLVCFTIPVADGERGKAFYGGLFGWEFATGNVPGGFQVSNSQSPGTAFNLWAPKPGE